jgi:hypothetical protein
VVTVLNGYIVLFRDPWTANVLELVDMPMNFRLILVAIAALHFVLAVLGERFLFPAISHAYEQSRKKR